MSDKTVSDELSDALLPIAHNIVNQLGDLWFPRPTFDDVEMRQATNDEADAFVVSLLKEVARKTYLSAAQVAQNVQDDDDYPEGRMGAATVKIVLKSLASESIAVSS